MSDPIRVLQVVTHMNRGGLESMIMNYYRNIDRSKIQFDFLTHRPEGEKKDYDDEILSYGGRIFHLPSLNPFSPLYLKALDEFFVTHTEYKIVHTHLDCMSGVVLKKAKQYGVPLRIAHCHSSSQDKNIKFIIKSIFKKNIKKYSTQMFACGQCSGEWMFGKNCFEVLPNAIDSDKYIYNSVIRKRIREQLDINNDCFVIGHVGRFCTVKNHKFIIDILKEIRKIEPNVKVLFAGQGELLNDIKDIVERNQLTSNVIFLGLRSDIPDILQAMDLFLLPSLYEGVPVSIIEAQASGLKCFISDKVPLDCAITDLVRQLSLNMTAEKWAEEIIKEKNYNRDNTKDLIVKSNFDIKSNAAYLERVYLSAMRLGRII